MTLQFSRSKTIGVGQPAPDRFLARAMLEDTAHTMIVETEFRLPDLEIVAARAQMVRVPIEVCTTAAAKMQAAVGLRVAPGLTATVDQVIGRAGCPHMANLLLESCHAVIQATLGARLQEWRNRTHQPNVDWDALRREWLEHTPMMIDTCLAYDAEGPLLRRLGVKKS
ncbi:MAG: DUF2889 domain-containing protein [Chloroflexota bacterium]|nr:MAG: DUF2889 domain-containing protein [Chloroflexota bacterium]